MANLSNINGKFVVEQTTGFVGIGTTDPGFLIEAAGTNAELALNASSIYRLRSTASDEFIITKNGVGDRLTISSGGDATFSGDVSLGDSKQLKLGNSADLLIFHDGANSYIKDTGTGNLLITSDGASVQINKGNTENMAEFITDGAVKLYYDSARKFETTSTGVTVTGVTSTSELLWGDSFSYGKLSWDTGYALIQGQSGKGIKLQPNASTALTLDTSLNATFAGKILVGTGATAAASLNAFTTTVSANLFSALRVIENTGASSYWDIGATNGASTLLNFYHNANTTPKISFTHTGGATFAGKVTVNSSNSAGVGLTIGGEAGAGIKTQYIFSGSGQRNWQIGMATHATQTLSITPSTANGNTTFTTPILNLNGSNNNATFANLVTMGPGTTGSPYDATTFLHVKGTTRSVVQQSSTNDAYYMFGDAAANNVAWLGYNHLTNQLSLHTSGSTYIDGNTTFAGSVHIDTKANSGLAYNVLIDIGSNGDGTIGYQTPTQLVDNLTGGYNGLTFADGTEALNTAVNCVIATPSRSSSPDPEDYQRSFSTEFKGKTASGSPGTGSSWIGLVSMSPYRPQTSGFYTTQLGFGADGTNGDMFIRRGTTTSWGDWRKFIISDGSGNTTFTGNVTISNSSPALNLTDTDNSSNIAFSSVGGALIVNSASDQVYQIGGAEKMRITSGGELQVTGNGVIRNEHSSANFSYWQQTGSDARLFTQYAQPLYFGTNSTTKMTILSDGNVGIGLTNPSEKLDVNGRVKWVTATGGDIYLFAGSKYYLDGGSNTYIVGESPDGDNIGFVTGGSTAMTIDENQNVGIGTTSPECKLHVVSTTTDNTKTVLIQNSSTGDASIMFNISGDTYSLGIDNSDGDKFKLSYGALGTNDRLVIDSSGNATFAGDVVAFSDERLKSDIKTLDGSKVYDMRGVSFIKDNKKSSGVIAQELEKIAPELVNNDSEYKAVAYGNLTGYLIEAVKELKAEIEELKKHKCDCKE